LHKNVHAKGQSHRPEGVPQEVPIRRQGEEEEKEGEEAQKEFGQHQSENHR